MDTPKSVTSATCMVAVIENRARELGFACVALPSYQITLVQFADSTTYLNTISTIYTWDPIELILSKTAEYSPFVTRVQEHLPSIPLTFVPRRFFDEIRGANIYSNCVNSIHDIGIESKYVCMAALGGLIHYVEHTQSIKLHTKSLQITMAYLESMLVIDYFTVRSLELVASTNSSMSISKFFPCKTPEGGRLLRTTLLQPARDLRVADARHQTILELRRNPALRFELEQCIQACPNTELVAGRLLQSTLATPIKTQVLTVLMLRNVFMQAKHVFHTLDKHSVCSNLLLTLLDFLDDRRIDAMLNEMRVVLDDELSFDKKLNKKHCLQAVKSECDSLLALAREVLDNVMEEVQALLNHMKSELNDPTLKLLHNENRGYYFQTSGDTCPSSAIQVIKKQAKTCFSTPHLFTLNEHLKQAKSEILLVSLKHLDKFLDKARDQITCLYNISYAVSTLDLLLAFVHFGDNYSCAFPSLYAPSLKIDEGIHPFLVDQFIPLNYNMNPFNTVQLITGKNCSGKTTYLKTLGVLCVLAYTGAPVPAKCLSLPQIDQIFSVLDEIESLEQNNSSFLTAMQQFSYILENSSEHSLVLIDEIGKGTSHEDGVALSWALIEKLVTVGCCTFISTHFSQLTELSELYNSVTNIFMENYTKNEGTNVEETGYGLNLASNFDLPKPLLDSASVLHANLSKTLGLMLSKKGIRAQQEKKLADYVLEILKIQGEYPPDARLAPLLELKKRISSSAL